MGDNWYLKTYFLYAYNLFCFWDVFLILLSMESSWSVLEDMVKLLAVCSLESNIWMKFAKFICGSASGFTTVEHGTIGLQDLTGNSVKDLTEVQVENICISLHLYQASCFIK